MARDWIFGRYRQPQLPSNSSRLSGYNAMRQRSAMEARPIAAEVQQQGRQDQPAFLTPPPAPPPRAPEPDAGLQVDPGIQRDIQEQHFGDFANQVLQRHQMPDPDTKVALGAGPDNKPVDQLERPDIEGLSEEPLPLTAGEHAGSAMRAAMQQAGLNPQSPDISHILPAIGQIGVAATKDTLGPPETPAQAALRNANAGRAGAGAEKLHAEAGEVAPTAQAKRKVMGSQAAKLDAETGEVAPNAKSKRGLQDSMSDRAESGAGLDDERAITEGTRRDTMKADSSTKKLLAQVALGNLNHRDVALWLKMAEQGVKDASGESAPGRLAQLLGEKNLKPEHVAEAKKLLEQAQQRVMSLGAPGQPPEPAAPAQSAVGAEQGPTPEEAYTELEDPKASAVDKDAARAFLKSKGLPESR